MPYWWRWHYRYNRWQCKWFWPEEDDSDYDSDDSSNYDNSGRPKWVKLLDQRYLNL